jgi:transcription initiation factor TFIIB
MGRVDRNMQRATQATAVAEEATCPICDGDNVDQDVDDCPPVCTECGYVIGSNDDGDPPIRNLAAGHSEADNNTTWTETYRVENATQQRLAQAFDKLENISNPVGIPVDLRRKAAEIYCEALKEGVTDGRKTAVTISVCLRVASLQQEMPIPVGVLIDHAAIEQTAFNACYSVVSSELELDLTPPNPLDYLEYLEGSLALDQRPRNNAQRTLEAVTGEPSFAGKNPAGVAAAAVYTAGEDLTQADVSEAVGVSTETIRQRVAQFREVSTDG